MEILAAEEGPDFEAPLLVLTADTSRETRRQALELGAADFLTKPIDVTELCIRARNLLSIYFLRRHLEKQNSVLQETVDARTAELERTNRSLEVEMSVRKEADTLLRLAEQRLRFLMTSSPSTIYSANIKPPHHITFISENVHALLGYRADAFRSNPALWQEIAHPDDLARLWSDLPAKLATGSCSVEIRLMHKDKSYRWIQSDVAVTHDSNGLPSELVGSWTDITDRKATEAALAKTAVEVSSANAQLLEFDRLKSEFVSTASHEMRTPLTVIREFAMLLTDGAVASDVEEQAECFEAILRNCDRLTGMLDYLLDFQRIESGKLRLQRRKVNIQDVMSRSHKDLLPKCMAKKITFDLVLSGQSLLVIADEEQIVQVLVNLISNAVKFTPEHGTITLKVVNSDGFVHVSIEDTGRGIAPENLECVFEAFRQIDRVDGPGFQGTGLGLTISNRIVDMHGGALSVESTVDKGTVFTFTLPLWSESEALQAYMHDKGDDTEDQLFLLLVTPSPKKGQVDYPDEKTLGLLANGLKLTLRSHDNGLILPNIGCVAVAIENNRAGTEATVERLHIALPAVLPQNMTLKYDIIDLSKSDYAQVYAQYVHKDEEPLLGKADAGANTAN